MTSQNWNEYRFTQLLSLLDSIPAATGEALKVTDWKAAETSACAIDGRSVGDPGASETVLAQAAQLVTGGADHVAALRRALTSPVMTLAPFTLARAVIEASATCLWLLSDRTASAERVGQSMSLRYESILEQQRWVRSLMPFPPEAQQLEASLAERVRGLCDAAAKRGISEKRSRRKGELIGFGGGLPPMTQRASDVGLGDVYRLYSGVAHGLTWATINASFRATDQADRLTQDLRPESAVMIITAALQVWLQAVHSVFVYASWDVAPWAARCDPLLDAAGLNERIRPWRA